ncbi:MAG TPA: NAD(P)/FAD-dependent oxidoreductase [Candidatus Limnocylindrales bacterium]|nr:NAD(P)/FAD-dependent oxidoreductase [Candidatus Limnocylindrales bacterium]
MDGTTERIDTVVIGAGQAGLSAGYYLAKRGLPFVILDADARIGDHWRDRWDSLRLYSPAKYDALPGRRFPAPSSHWPTAREMADYLETYARWFELPVQSGVRVTAVDRDREGFVVATDGGRRIGARQVIIATGPFREPSVPAFAGELDPSIQQLHSHDYRNPAQLLDGPVLVVGLSHSGADIAFETATAGHRTILSGTSHGQVPIRVTDSKRAMLGWPVVEFFFKHVATIRTPMGRAMRPHVRQGGGPLLRIRLQDLDRAGVERHDEKTVGVKDGRPVLADGTVLDVANVIWATGYRPDYSFVNAPITGPDGWPEEARGVSPTVPGLYFLGVPFQYAFSSMLVAGAGRDARYVVDRVAERVAATSRPRAAAAAAA